MWDTLGGCLFRMLGAIYIFGGGFLILYLGYGLGKTREAIAVAVVHLSLLLIFALLRMARRRREYARSRSEIAARVSAEQQAEQARQREIEDILGRYANR